MLVLERVIELGRALITHNTDNFKALHAAFKKHGCSLGASCSSSSNRASDFPDIVRTRSARRGDGVDRFRRCTPSRCTTYGTAENIRALEDDGIRSFVPLPDWHGACVVPTGPVHR